MLAVVLVVLLTLIGGFQVIVQSKAFHGPFFNAVPPEWQENIRRSGLVFYFIILILLGLGTIRAQNGELSKAESERKQDQMRDDIRRNAIIAVEEIHDARDRTELSRIENAESLNAREIAQLAAGGDGHQTQVAVSLTPQPATVSAQPAIAIPRPKSTQRPQALRTSAPASVASLNPAPPLLATNSQQQRVLLGLLAQTPQASESSGVWLSQIVRGLSQGRYDGVPDPDSVDFPATALALRQAGKLVILDTIRRNYAQAGSATISVIDYRVRLTNYLTDENGNTITSESGQPILTETAKPR